MIEFRDFSFGFKELQLFEKMDLHISSNGVTVLTGGNGSGKTTFCRLIMGFLKEYTGTLKLNDNELKKLATVSISEKITYLKQEPAANIVSALPEDDLRIWQTGFTCKAFDKTIIFEALKFFDLEEMSQQPVWELSSGQLKRVGLAALLLNKDKFWLLDEPTSGLDDKLISKLLELIRAQKKTGNGLLIITHRHEKFTSVADRILEIHNKKIRELK